MIYKNYGALKKSTSNEKTLFIFNPIEVFRLFLNIFNPLHKESFEINSQNPWPSFMSFSKNNTRDHLKKFSKEEGELIIALYFFQIFNRNQICVDIRPKFFSFKDGQVFWSQSTFTFRFTAEFLKGLQNIYTGLFNQDHKLAKNAMIDMGLIPGWLDDPKKNQIFSIFLEHFSKAHQIPVAFSLAHFFRTFSKLLLLLIRLRVKLSAEFAVLGIYLFSLYLSLRKCPYPLDVMSAFQTGMTNNYKQGSL